MRGCHAGFYNRAGTDHHRQVHQEIADTLALPVLLVVQPKGASVPPLLPSCGAFAVPHAQPYRGHLLNDCSEALYKRSADAGTQAGLPVVGYLPTRRVRY